MAMTLYRKYRPKTFKELIGQNHIKTTLEHELESEKMAHAYLFSGPRGLGKTTTARLLAKAVNCQKRKDGQSEPCNSCDSCNEIMSGASIDVMEIDAASNTGVDNVRENIIENSRFTPTRSKFKVFIIDEVHMLSTSAFNALLKTLEEPPAHAMFILATTEIHKVPQTIISRCQHFEFRSVSSEDLVKRLNHLVTEEKKSVDKEILENITYYSSGSIRDAESLLGQVLSLGDKKITVEQAELVLPRARFDLAVAMLEFLTKKDSAGAITLINDMVQDGVDLDKFTDSLIETLRKTLLIKVHERLGDYVGGITKDLEKKIKDLSAQVHLDFLIKALEIFIDKKRDLKIAEIVQLPLELAVLELIGENESDGGFQARKSSQQEAKKGVDTVQPAVEQVKQEIEKEPVVVAQVPKKEVVIEVEKKAEEKKSIITLSLSQIIEKWQEIIESVKDHNHSLASTLKIGKPSSMGKDGVLEVGFAHDFHSQRVNDIKNKTALEGVLKDVFGVDLIVRTVIVKSPEKEEVVEESVMLQQQEHDGEVDEIASAFGGQVIS